MSDGVSFGRRPETERDPYVEGGTGARSSRGDPLVGGGSAVERTGCPHVDPTGREGEVACPEGRPHLDHDQVLARPVPRSPRSTEALNRPRGRTDSGGPRGPDE